MQPASQPRRPCGPAAQMRPIDDCSDPARGRILLPIMCCIWRCKADHGMIAKARRKRRFASNSTRWSPRIAGSTITVLRKFQIASAPAVSDKKGRTPQGAARKPKGVDLANQFETGEEIGNQTPWVFGLHLAGCSLFYRVRPLPMQSRIFSIP